MHACSYPIIIFPLVDDEPIAKQLTKQVVCVCNNIDISRKVYSEGVPRIILTTPTTSDRT